MLSLIAAGSIVVDAHGRVIVDLDASSGTGSCAVSLLNTGANGVSQVLIVRKTVDRNVSIRMHSLEVKVGRHLRTRLERDRVLQMTAALRALENGTPARRETGYA